MHRLLLLLIAFSVAGYEFREEFDAVEPFRAGRARVSVDHGDDVWIGYIDNAGDFVWYPTY